jgi:molecular chaperone GrpE
MAGAEDRPARVRVMDKRRALHEQPEPQPRSEVAGARPDEARPEAAPTGAPDPEAAAESVARAEQDLLDDLRRLQAEFDNYRKRVMREQTAMASRASARLVERLLPVLDNFERAMHHGEGGPGLELVYRELRGALEGEGLAEIDAEGRPFDPRVHEAFQAEDDPEAAEPVVKSVFRRGYTLGDRVLRPAMVVVARPPENEQSEDPAADATEQEES